MGSVAPIQVGSAMPIQVGSAAPWGAPRTIQTVRSVNYGYSAAPHIVPLNQPGTVSILKQSQVQINKKIHQNTKNAMEMILGLMTSLLWIHSTGPGVHSFWPAFDLL